MGSTRLPGKVDDGVGRQNGAGAGAATLPRRSRVRRSCAVRDPGEAAPMMRSLPRRRAWRRSVPRLGKRCAGALSRRLPEMSGADIVMRVTTDCPLIDPGIMRGVSCACERRTRRRICRQQHAAELAAWPGLRGFHFRDPWSCRAVRGREPYEREHVSPWIGPGRRSPRQPGGTRRAGWPNERWTLDFPEDLDFLRRLFALLPPAPAIPPTTDILDVIEQNPQIALLNRAHRDKSRAAASPVP